MNNLEIYNAGRAVPEEALKPITAGRLKGMSDINPMWRIKKLTEIFGACGTGWWYEILDKHIQPGANDEQCAFVDIALYYERDGKVSHPIYGTGGSSFVTAEKNGLHTSDECFKMALTDAISVAAKALGIGADVYFAKDRTKYSEPPKQEAPKPQPEPMALSGVEHIDPVKVYKCECCGQPITDYKGKNAKELEIYSLTHYKQRLCGRCIVKVSKNANQ